MSFFFLEKGYGYGYGYEYGYRSKTPRDAHMAHTCNISLEIERKLEIGLDCNKIISWGQSENLSIR